MKDLLSFLKTHLKDVLSAVFMVVAIVLSAVAVHLYVTKGANTFNPNIDPKVTASVIAAVVIGAISLIFSIKLGKYVSYLVLIYALIGYISTQVNYITNVFVAIDGEVFSTEFLCTFIFLVIGIVFSLVSAILNTEPFFKVPFFKLLFKKSEEVQK